VHVFCALWWSRITVVGIVSVWLQTWLGMLPRKAVTSASEWEWLWFSLFHMFCASCTDLLHILSSCWQFAAVCAVSKLLPPVGHGCQSLFIQRCKFAGFCPLVEIRTSAVSKVIDWGFPRLWYIYFYEMFRRNCLLKQVIEGKIKGEMEVVRTRGRRRKKLLDDLKDRRGYSHLKEDALDRTMWRHRFGGGFGPVVRQNTEWMNVLVYL